MSGRAYSCRLRRGWKLLFSAQLLPSPRVAGVGCGLLAGPDLCLWEVTSTVVVQRTTSAQ